MCVPPKVTPPLSFGMGIVPMLKYINHKHTVMDELKSQSLAAYCQANGVTAISPVRKNTNGYPFVTLISKSFDGGASNIYFSKSKSEEVELDMKAPAWGAKDARIVETTNEAGEPRLKIAGAGSDYTDVADLF